MFKKVRARVSNLYPELDISKLDYFKVVVDGRLVEGTYLKVNHNLVFEVETTHSMEQVTLNTRGG